MMGDLVEDADRVLEASLGLRLEVETTRPWSLDADEHLDIALAALRRDDPGDDVDVDVVVGLIGALRGGRADVTKDQCIDANPR